MAKKKVARRGVNEKAQKERVRRLISTSLGAALGSAIGSVFAEDPEKFTKSISEFLETVTINGVPFKVAATEAYAASVSIPPGVLEQELEREKQRSSPKKKTSSKKKSPRKR